MFVLNKWNGRKYKVIEIGEKDVTLERLEDYYNKKKGVFLVSKSEYFFSYVPKK